MECKSDGLITLHDYCARIADNADFISIKSCANQLLAEIETILKDNTLVINPANRVFSITKCNAESNFSELLKTGVLDAFGLELENWFSVIDPSPLSNLEEKVLGLITAKNMDTFRILNAFYSNNIDIYKYIEALSELQPQLAFYIAYVKFVKTAVEGGIPVCRPVFDKGEYTAQDCANASLVIKFIASKTLLENIVCNNINIPNGGMFILSGPNQGGKTIYLKAVGLTAYLARCGCLVFCRKCTVPFYDMIYTHFMQKEVLGKGRLVEETERMEKLMGSITQNTLILLNESFASTRRKDGIEVALHYLNRFEIIGCSVGFVSHYYEIPEIYNNGENKILSLSSGIVDDGKRTYRILNRQGGGLAYARDIAQNCGMTYEQIRDEIARCRD